MRRSLVIPILLAVTAGTARGQEYLRPVHALAQEEACSPAAILFTPWNERSEAEVAGRFRHEDRAWLPQEGDGLREAAFRYASLRRLSARSAVRGRVDWERGVKENVRWNTSSDYLLLFPYVTADTVGGNLQKEQYAFSGAYAAQVGKVVLALEGSYRALHEYRRQDPRPRNITSDLTVRGSAGYDLGGHVLAGTATYRRYHQIQAVSFMNPLGANTVLYHMTGLGTTFARFTGNGTFTDVRFRGNGLALGALLMPKGDGWSAGAGYTRFDAVRHLPNQNEVPYTDLLVQDLDAFAAWRHIRPSFSYGLSARAGYELRQGSEAIVPSVVASGVEDIPELTLYRMERLSAALDGVLQWENWSLCPSVSYRFSAASRKESGGRRMEYAAVGFSLKGGWLSTRDRWTFAVNLTAGYTLRPDGVCFLPDTEPAILTHYTNLYGIRTTDSVEAALDGRLRLAVKAGTGLYLRPEAAAARFFGAGWTERLSLAIGVDF